MDDHANSLSDEERNGERFARIRGKLELITDEQLRSSRDQMLCKEYEPIAIKKLLKIKLCRAIPNDLIERELL